MIYKLSVSKHFYSDPEEVERLKELGFQFRTFVPSKEMELMYRIHKYYPNHKYRIINQYPDNLKIEINTLEELQKFISKYGRIVLKDDEIEIYNDKRE